MLDVSRGDRENLVIRADGREPNDVRIDKRRWTDWMIGYRRLAVTIGLCVLMHLLCAPSSAEVLKLRIDPGTTQIVATVKEPLPRFRGAASGSFTVLRGQVEGDVSNPVKNGHVEIAIDAASYSSGDTRRDQAVKHDTLEVSRFPEITFVSKRIENFQWEDPGADATATLVGNLTLHGVTREVRIPIDAVLSHEKQLSVDGEVKLQFADFKLVQPSALFGALRTGKAVYLSFRIIAVPENQLPTVPEAKSKH